MKTTRLLLILLLIFSLFVFGCDEDNDDDDDDDATPTDDDTDDEAYDQPWDEDLARPIVRINQPDDGEFIVGGAVTVRGTVTGEPADELLINGKPVNIVSGGQFQTTVNFSNGQTVLPIYASASTTEGAIGADRVVAIRGEMSEPEQIVEDALLLMLGDEAFPAIDTILAQALVDLDLLPLFADLNPIIDALGVTVDVTAASIGGANVEGEFTDGGMHFYAELTEVTLGTSTTFLGIPSDSSVTLASIGLDIDADVELRDGAVTVTIAGIDVSHGDVSYEGILGFLGAPITSLLLNVVEGVVELAVRLAVPGLLENVLTDLAFQTVLIGFDIEAGLTTLDIGPGAAVLGLDLNVFLTDPIAHDWPRGSLATPGLPPDPLTDRPAEAASFGLGVSLGDDLLNRIFYGVAESDLLSFSLDDTGTFDDALEVSLTAGTLAVLLPAFADVNPQIPAMVRLYPAVPPLTLPSDDGALTLVVPDMRVEFYLLPPEEDPWLALTMAAYLEFGIDMNATGDGALLFAFPIANATVQTLDNPIGEAAPVIDPIVDWLTQTVQPLLNLIFENLPIRIPEVFGVTVDPLWIGTAGENLDYWTSYIGLTVAE